MKLLLTFITMPLSRATKCLKATKRYKFCNSKELKYFRLV